MSGTSSDEERVTRLEKSLEDVDRRLRFIEQRLAGEEAGTQGPLPATSTTPSIRQFLTGKNPTDDVQRSLVIGYFLERYANYGSFNSRDLEKGFVEAREKVPSNVADKILKNVWKGHMMQTQGEKDGLKAYALTNAGTKFVETSLK